MGILKYIFLAKSRLVFCTFQLSLMYLTFWIHQRHGKVSWSPLSCSLSPLPPPPPNKHTYTHTRIAILLPHKDCKLSGNIQLANLVVRFRLGFPLKGAITTNISNISQSICFCNSEAEKDLHWKWEGPLRRRS